MLVRKKALRFPLLILLLSASTVSGKLAAQSESPWGQPPELKVFGFADIFYTYDFNQPTTAYRQTFLFNHNRHNEFNINLGLIGLKVDQARYRANITLQAGTYANDNYASEPGTLKNIYEAYAGIALSRKGNLWLDAGIFSSNLGFESAVSIDNWTLTRSLVAEESPFFLAGAKVTYAPSDVFSIQGLVTNGWQRIKRVPGNSLPSFGTQLVITPNENYTFNWSTFIGTDDPDSTRRMMYFNNLYVQMQITGNFGLIAGLDFGLRQQQKGSVAYDDWYGITLIARYKFTEKWAAAMRGELYLDSHAVIVVIEDSPNGFRTTGLSANLDFTPVRQVACRIEGRWFHSPDEIFTAGNDPTHDNFFVTASLAVKLGKQIR